MKPTNEQAAAIAAFTRGDSLVLEAGAGTGKTSTLRLLGDVDPNRRGLYIAYNKAIATEAKSKFPANVTCATAHSFAFRAVGRRYASRLNGPRIPAWQVAKALGLAPLPIGSKVLAPDKLANIVMEAVGRFCTSADEAPTRWHMPYVEGLEDDHVDGYGDMHRSLGVMLEPFMVKAWDDLQGTSGKLRFQHDHYLKLWQLSHPKLDADFILFDEAQDANPVIAAIVDEQTHAQRVMVGDRAQAIYGWRGAIDAMAKFDADSRLYLSQSFRFGDAIAEEANRWLERLDTPLRLKGTPSIASEVGEVSNADAVLCRTNAGALEAVLSAQEVGVKAHLVGGASDVAAFARAAQDLQRGRGTSHRELFVFRNWQEVQQYVANDPDGSDLSALVRIIDMHGPETVINALERAVPEDQAELVVSTAHKSKGREWGTVRIADDFESKSKDGKPKDLEPGEIMLRYVAVTRAKDRIDLGPLAESEAMALAS